MGLLMIYDFLGLNNSFPADILPLNVFTGLDKLTTIIQAIGIVVIIYIIILIFSAISNILKNRRIKKIYNKVYEMDEKIDRLLSKQENEDKPCKPEKTKKEKSSGKKR
jgi:hypothetical protein